MKKSLKKLGLTALGIIGTGGFVANADNAMEALSYKENLEPVDMFADTPSQEKINDLAQSIKYESTKLLPPDHDLYKDFNYPVEIKDKSVADLFVSHQVQLSGNTLIVGSTVAYDFDENTKSIEVIKGDSGFAGYIQIEIGSGPGKKTVYFGLDQDANQLVKFVGNKRIGGISLPEKQVPVTQKQKEILDQRKKLIQKHIPNNKILESDTGPDYAIYTLKGDKTIECRVSEEGWLGHKGVTLILKQGNREKIIDNGRSDRPIPMNQLIDIYLEIFALDLTDSEELSTFLNTKLSNNPREKKYEGLIDFNTKGTRQSVDDDKFAPVFDFISVRHRVDPFDFGGIYLVSRFYLHNKNSVDNVDMILSVKDGKISFSSELSLYRTPFGPDAEKIIEDTYEYKVDYKQPKDMTNKEKAIFEEYLFQLCLDFENRRYEY